MHPDQRTGRRLPLLYFLLPAVLVATGAGLWSLIKLFPDSDVWKGEVGSPELWMVILGGAALMGTGILAGVILLVLRLRSQQWRFSIRALLIVSTVVAAGLGWIAWMRG